MSRCANCLRSPAIACHGCANEGVRPSTLREKPWGSHHAALPWLSHQLFHHPGPLPLYDFAQPSRLAREHVRLAAFDQGEISHRRRQVEWPAERLITDNLRSYRAAVRDLGISDRHRRGRLCNNRVQNSHQPTRRQERKMQGFKSPGSAQRFLSTHAATSNTFNVQRRLNSAKTHRAFRASAMAAAAAA